MAEKKVRCNKMAIIITGCMVLFVAKANAGGITPYGDEQTETVGARTSEPVSARTSEPVYAKPLETSKENEIPQQKGQKVEASKSNAPKRNSKASSGAGGGGNKLSPYIDPYSQTNYNTGRSQSVFTPGF